MQKAKLANNDNNIQLQKFDTLSKREMKIIKTMKNTTTKCQKNECKSRYICKVAFFTLNSPQMTRDVT